MKKLIHLLMGYVELQVTGAFPERLLNLCAQHRLAFWKLRWMDSTSFLFRVSLRDRKRLEELAERAMCEVCVQGRYGAAAAALNLGKRWGFLLGLALCVGAVSVLSQFLLVVEVTGNEKVPSAVILSELQRLGVRPGAYGPGIDGKAVSNEALMALPQLAFMAVNVNGTKAEVSVKEAVPAPELLDEDTPADIVARSDGIIEDIHAAQGRAMFADGDIVAKGEVLISGEMKLRQPQYGTVDTGWLVVHAAGEVTARTWRTLEETVPLQTAVKRYTGQEQKLYSLRILWGELEFFQNSSISWANYDKITNTEFLTLFGRSVPVGLTTVTLREYVTEEQPLDMEDAAVRLEEALRFRLEQLMSANEGTVFHTDVVRRVDGGLLTVTLLAECREQIGKTVERPGETGRIPGNNAGQTAD